MERSKRKLSDKEKKDLKNINTRLYRKRKQWAKIGVDEFVPIRGIKEFENLTKKEINRYIRTMDKFLKSNDSKLYKNIYGLIYTESDKKLLERTLKERNERKRKQWDKIKDVPLQGYGEDIVTPMDISDMQKNNKYVSFNARNVNIENIKNRKEFDKLINKLKQEGTDTYDEIMGQRLKENMIKAIKTVDENKGRELIKELEGLSAKQFMNMYWSSDIMTPAYIYHDWEGAENKSFANIRRNVRRVKK